MLTAEWRKSTKSGPNCDNCVEVRLVADTIEVRDTKNPTGGTLSFTKPEWLAFIGGVENNEFNI